MSWHFKKLLVLAFSVVLLLSGGTLLWLQANPWRVNSKHVPASPNLKQTTIENPAIKGAFPVDLAKNISFQDNDKDVFDLTLINYHDQNDVAGNALLFPKDPQESILLPSATGLRQSIWQDIARIVTDKSPKDALFLGWWDDSQRMHFLTGRDIWLKNPGAATFNSPVWQALQPELILADAQDDINLKNMARWLTLDSTQALQDMAEHFGKNRPLYLVVNNDMLVRLGEMADYGGIRLNIFSRTVPASNNLHNDISRIKQLSQEEGDGNYLVQKEGAFYHVWIIPKLSRLEPNALLIRLLPFVESLKKLPANVQLVYQSHWGGYFSIYRLNF